MPSSPNYLIVHGAHGSPDENWFGWLAENLQGSGRVLRPQFPTPEGQNLSNWMEVAKAALAGCDTADTVLVGHSSGAAFVLRMAEKTEKPFKAVFPVCPFAQDLGLAEFDPLNATFVHPAFDWDKVKRGAEHIVCFAGDDDPYVPLDISKKVADQCGAEFVAVPKGGHLNAKAGFTKFPLLLEKVLRVR